MDTEEKGGMMALQSMRWLMELELISNPQVINTLKLNILSTSEKIKEIEILSMHLHGKKDMLIWLDLTWWGKQRWNKKGIVENADEAVRQLLPSFRIRVITDYNIMKLAITKLREYAEKQEQSRVDLEKNQNENHEANVESFGYPSVSLESQV